MLGGMASVGSQRMFPCDHCGRRLSICRTCDRGPRYCRRDCSRQARPEAHSAAHRTPTAARKPPPRPQSGICCVRDAGLVNFYRLRALEGGQRARGWRQPRRRQPPKAHLESQNTAVLNNHKYREILYSRTGNRICFIRLNTSAAFLMPLT